MKHTLLIICCSIITAYATAQACNPNFDFEKGNFDNWECSAGSITAAGDLQLSAGQPLSDRHIIMPTVAKPLLDPYGKFPLNSPNGSNYCVQLGNAQKNAQAERISYTFVIPPDKNDYGVIFNYAVVFENPSHALFEQPKFTSQVFDVTSNKYIDCGSFDFAASSGLPGFLLSTVPNATEVYYKPWSSVIVKLVGFAGKTIRLEFTTNDCTRGGHFGYAYIDVVNNCNGTLILGNVVCSASSEMTLTAPPGFAGYKWYSADFSQLLSTANTLKIKPVPPPGAKYALEITPFPGLGCIDTIYTIIKEADAPFVFKVYDTIGACLPEGIALQTALLPTNTPGLHYHYFTDAGELNGVASYFNVTLNGRYFIRAENDSGCTDLKPVEVITWPIPDFAVKDPPKVIAPETVNLTTAVSDPRYTYTYWGNKDATQVLGSAPTAVDASGTYFIKAKDIHGCSAVKPVTVVIGARMVVPTAFTPNGDGHNDVFRFIARGGVKDLQYFKVFDRWGHLVYSTRTYGEGWDGTVKGQLQNPGMYVWMVRAIDYTGVVYEKQGNVMLVR